VSASVVRLAVDIGGTFTDIDYVRVIRHGIGKDGKSLVIMPSDFSIKYPMVTWVPSSPI